MTEGSTFEDKGDSSHSTDIDESSESSLAADTSIDSSDNEDESEKTSPTLSKSLFKLKRESSVHRALEFAKDHQGSNIGLLKYFSQGMKEDVEEYWKKEEERMAVSQEKKNVKKKSGDMEKKVHKHELAWVHQQRK